ncbi:MAG: outer membrane lipoprotein chaperone LolA [Gammaproteobacteria bacterium]|jgi:outer membrane lipoprotein carrier protein
MLRRKLVSLWQTGSAGPRAMFTLACMLASIAVDAQTPATVNAPVVTSAEEYALHQLVAVLQQTRTLQASVEQLLMDQEGRELQETRARLTMQKPDNFRWEILQPYPELQVTDGHTIWRYEPDLEQVTIETFNSKLERTPVMLLNGTEQTIGKSYKVSATKLADGVRQQFVLQPKQPDSLFVTLTLTFNGAVLEEMHFEDSLGQKTSLAFKMDQRNQQLDSALFHFTPPQGVEVINNTHN